MLVVSRKAKQSLMIGSDIEILIIEAKDGNVKIGINAPKGISILRKELFDEIKNQNSEALNVNEEVIKSILGDK